MTVQEISTFLNCSIRTVQRYMKSGKLPYDKIGKYPTATKSDVAKLYDIIQEKKEKHASASIKKDRTPAIENVAPKEIKKILRTPTKSILNETGQNVLIETTKHMKSKDILDLSCKGAILRYSLAVQLVEKYQELALETDEKAYHDLVRQYNSDIRHYEVQLGLTPASLSKIKPPKAKEEITIDPMEALIND